MNKQQKIEEFLKQPIKVGDYVSIQGLSLKQPLRWEEAEVKSINGNELSLQKDHYNLTKYKNEIKRVTDKIGLDPFKKELRATGCQVDIVQLLWRAGYKIDLVREGNGVETLEIRNDEGIAEVCDTPIIIDETGNEVEFQRGLVWSLEQKQLLIESIWNNIEIGKVVVRARKFAWVQKRIKEGKIEHTAYFDLVDGKQRVNALLSFIKGEFADANGVSWNELSESTKRRFLSYRNVSYIELDENTSDSETIACFLAINFTGVPMSKKHIEFVQSIKF